MPELDDDLVTELREQLDAEKKQREELIEELRESRKPAESESEPTPTQRMARGHEKAEGRRRKAAEKKGGGDG